MRWFGSVISAAKKRLVMDHRLTEVFRGGFSFFIFQCYLVSNSKILRDGGMIDGEVSAQPVEIRGWIALLGQYFVQDLACLRE